MVTRAASTLERILASWESGALSSPIALMEMLVATKDPDLVARFLTDARSGELQRLLVENAGGCARVADIVRDDAPLRDVSDVKALFDRAVDACEEASVALYSLGSAAILDSATAEIVLFLEDRRLLGPGRKVLDLGCGIGRLEVALSPRVQSLVGIDISPKMVSVARRRTSALGNVRIELGDGFDFAFDDDAFDLVLAVDSMPYLVGLGEQVVDANIGEVSRVVRPGGDFVILELSYREDSESDRQDVASMSDRFGFDVVVNGSSPFTLWSGRAFWLRRR